MKIPLCTQDRSWTSSYGHPLWARRERWGERTSSYSRVSSKHRYSLKYAATFCMALLVGLVSSIIGAFMSRSSQTRWGVSGGTPNRIPEDVLVLMVSSQQTGIPLECLFHCLFFHVENCKKVPVPVEKRTGGAGIPQVPCFLYVHT